MVNIIFGIDQRNAKKSGRGLDVEVYAKKAERAIRIGTADYVEEEKLEHIWVCNEARKKIRKEWIVEVDKWRKESKGTELIEKLVELLSGKINLGTCKYARAFEW